MPMKSRQISRRNFVKTGALALPLLASGCASQGGGGKVYYVDGSAPNAADSNPGTDARPWKTLNRAGKAKELKPGDTVFIKSGIYREDFWIKASGEPGKPITFAAAPGARVVIKGSELITQEWTKVTPERAEKEPYPNAYQNVWKVKLGEEFFTDKFLCANTSLFRTAIITILRAEPIGTPLRGNHAIAFTTAKKSGKWKIVSNFCFARSCSLFQAFLHGFK